jgi:hypothetical protein
MTGFQGLKNVVISSKKYDIHKLTLALDILNKSVVPQYLVFWQGAYIFVVKESTERCSGFI